MKRETAIPALRLYERDLRAMGAASLYLYGSIARDEADETSDIDLLVDENADRVGRADLVGIRLFLEEKFGLSVDIVMRENLDPVWREAIEREAMRIF